MKRKLCIVLLIGLLTVFTGCSASTTTSSDDSTSAQSDQSASLKPDRTMDLLGKVTAVDGSTLQVAGLEMPQVNEDAQDPGGQGSQGGPPPARNNSGDSQGAVPTEKPTSDQQPPVNTDSAGTQGRSASNQQPPGRTYTETGKTYTLVIDDNSLIISRTMGSDGTAAEKVLSESDLKEGDILRIWVEKLDTSGGESTVVYAELETQEIN